MQEAVITERGRMPDGLFMRQLEAERHQSVAFLGLLFLLQPGTDPESQAAGLTPQLGPLDELPPDGAVIPIWTDDADAGDCDAQAIAEARGRLDAAAVALVATVQDAAGERKVAYRQLSRESSPMRAPV
jgi:hypothetical protein